MVPNPKDIILTKEEVEEVLEKIKICIENNRIQYDPNKLENFDFMSEYKLFRDDVIRIISKLTYKNFSRCTISYNPKYLGEHLYIFGIKECLKEAFSNKINNVVIYIKFYLISNNNGKDLTFVVSFHEAEYEIHYAFK